MSEPRGTHSGGRYSYEGLSRLLHEKARLSIMTSLMTHADGLRFAEIKQLCTLTDGNLSRHLEALREAGLVEIWKGYEQRRPQTLARLTPEGRQRFLSYISELERVVKDALSHEEARASEPTLSVLPDGWVLV